MSISNKKELKVKIENLNRDLQNVSNFIGPEDPDEFDSKEFQIKFPKGYIRTVASLGSDLNTLGDKVLIKNISYSLQLTDFYAWHLNRTDIALTLRGMIIKSGIVTYCSIMESLFRVEPFKNIRASKSFYKRLEGFEKDDLINEKEHKAFKWLWDARDSIHLYNLEEAEHSKYTYADYNKASKITRHLLEKIKKTNPNNS